MAPAISEKMKAIFRRPMAKRAAKKSGAPNRGSLLATATEIHAEITKVTAEVKAHSRRITDVPRPAPPPDRDPLFQRPKDAPLSEYDKQVAAFTELENENRGLQKWTRQLRERVTAFNANVQQLKAGHEPARKMGKAEHDMEALENASLNLETEMVRLEKEVEKAKIAGV